MKKAVSLFLLTSFTYADNKVASLALEAFAHTVAANVLAMRGEASEQNIGRAVYRIDNYVFEDNIAYAKDIHKEYYERLLSQEPDISRTDVYTIEVEDIGSDFVPRKPGTLETITFTNQNGKSLRYIIGTLAENPE